MLQIFDSVENDALEHARRAGFHGDILERSPAFAEIENKPLVVKCD
jgi:hypothetical protein